MVDTFFDPAQPNSKRVITLTYQTDSDGELSINIHTKGFDDAGEAYVGFYLMNTLEVLSEIPPKQI